MQLPEDAPLPSAVREITDEYERSSEGMLNAVKKEWRDESLLEDVNLYGQDWKKGKSPFSSGKSSNTSQGTVNSNNAFSRD